MLRFWFSFLDGNKLKTNLQAIDNMRVKRANSLLTITK